MYFGLCIYLMQLLRACIEVEFHGGEHVVADLMAAEK